MWVELATFVSLGDIEQRQIPNTSDLNIVGCLDEVGTRDRAVRNEARAIAWLDAPSNLDALRVSDDRVRTGFWGSEDAKVVYGVDCSE